MCDRLVAKRSFTVLSRGCKVFFPRTGWKHDGLYSASGKCTMFQYIDICVRSIPREGSTADAVLSDFGKAGKHAIVGPDLLMRHVSNSDGINQA